MWMSNKSIDISKPRLQVTKTQESKFLAAANVTPILMISGL
jgi:hypothetical protein